MTDMRTTRAGLHLVFGVTTDHRTTRAGLIVVYSETAPIPPIDTGPPIPGSASSLARGGACYLDSFLEYDGRHVSTPDGLYPGVSVALSGGSTWLAGETLTLTASNTIFTAGEVGNVLILHAADDTKVRFTIGAFISTAVVTGVTDVTVPTAMRTGSVTVWDRAVDVIAGLEHLEAALVGILGDDHVVGAPYHASVTRRTVTGGEVELGDFYSHVFVGLSYLSDLETLDIDKPSGQSNKGQNIAVSNIGLMLQQSRPAWLGGQPPSNDSVDPLEDLQEMPMPDDEEYETLVTDYRSVNVKTKWNTNGRVFIRSVDPTPLTVLAIVPAGFVPPNQ
jgi:hypothetical protein